MERSELMTNLTQQVKHGAGQALATLSQGWRELRSRAGNALTHFQGRRADGDEGSDDGLPALGSWGFMAADVVNSKDQIVVRLEAPGLSRKDFNVELRGNVLCVAGEKRLERESKADGQHVFQCAYGNFRRDIPLPAAVDADRAKATYRDGVLRIALPKSDGDQPSRFVVQVK
jgi:HSP20 family protein